jgi:hypothetical protein
VEVVNTLWLDQALARLTAAQRVALQDWWARSYLARLDRAQWARDFYRDRGTGTVHLRAYAFGRAGKTQTTRAAAAVWRQT